MDLACKDRRLLQVAVGRLWVGRGIGRLTLQVLLPGCKV